jgi:hypothetical protein
MKRARKLALVGGISLALVAGIGGAAQAGTTSQGWPGATWHPRITWTHEPGRWSRQLVVRSSDAKGLPVVYSCKTGPLVASGSVNPGAKDVWEGSSEERGKPTVCRIRPLTFEYVWARNALGMRVRVLVIDSPAHNADVRFHAIIGDEWGSGAQHWHGTVRHGHRVYRVMDDHDGPWDTELFLAADY